jgi:hypothetical protein
MRFIAFLKIYKKSFATIDDMYITSGDHLGTIQTDIGEYWKDKNAIHYEGLNIIIVYNVSGTELVEAYVSGAVYDWNLKIVHRDNHQTEYDLLRALPKEYAAYLAKPPYDEYSSLKTHLLESVTTRLNRFHMKGSRNPDQSKKTWPKYLALLSNHPDHYVDDAHQFYFGIADNLDHMRGANGIFWDSNSNHLKGMNIIRIYDISGSNPVEVWDSIAVYSNNNNLVGRSTGANLEEALLGLGYNIDKRDLPSKLSPVPNDVIYQILIDLGFSGFKVRLTPPVKNDFTEQIRAARLEEYGKDVPEPIKIPSKRKNIVDPPFV